MNEAPPLPRARRLGRDEWLRITLLAVMVGLGYVIYHRLASEVGAFDRRKSTLSWVVHRWDTGRLSHGAVVYYFGWTLPLFYLGLLWRARHRLAAAPKRVAWTGLAMVAGCLLLHYVGVKTEQHRLSLLSLIGLTWALPLFFSGWAVARILAFPSAILIFTLPLNFLDAPMYRVRIRVARLAAGILNALGIECAARATAIVSTTEGGFTVQLPPADLGLGAFILFLFVMAMLAHFSSLSFIRKWVFFALGPPLYAAGLTLVMVVVSILAQTLGTDIAGPRPGLYTGAVFIAGLGWALLAYRLVRYEWIAGTRCRLRRWSRQLASEGRGNLPAAGQSTAAGGEEK